MKQKTTNQQTKNKLEAGFAISALPPFLPKVKLQAH